MESPGKIIAVSLAFSGFTCALLAGLAAGNDAPPTLVRAIVSLFACLLLGQWLGHAGTTAVREMLDRFRDEHPIPERVDMQQGLMGRPSAGSAPDTGGSR